jgi:hypothetical protein
MKLIDRLLSDIEVLRGTIRIGKLSTDRISPESEQYLAANSPVIMSFLNVVYKEHTREERFQLKLANIRLDESAIPDGFFGIASMAVEALDNMKKGWGEVTNDNLHMLHRALLYASHFNTDHVRGQLAFSPVNSHLPQGQPAPNPDPQRKRD